MESRHPSRHNKPMTFVELGFALFALLATPGPTNTLLAVAGAQAVRRPMLLPVAELAAYLATVVPLSIWGQQWLATTPTLRFGLTLAAAIWVAALALRLWRQAAKAAAEGAARAEITPLDVGLTTLLNPKALIFGLILIPAGPGLLVGLCLFTGLVVLVSLGWLWLGAQIAGRFRPLVNRGGAVWLGMLSAFLASRVLTG